MRAENPCATALLGDVDTLKMELRGGRIGPNTSDPARCVNTMCAGPRRTGLEFD